MTRKITFNGRVICDDSDITVRPLWVVSKVDGLLDGAGGVFEQGQRVQADGVWTTQSWLGGLAGGLTGKVLCDNPADCETAISQIRDTVSKNPAPLTFHFAAGDQTIMVKRDGVVAIDRDTPTTFTWSCTVLAPDPTWYAGGPGSPVGPGLPTPPGSDLRTLVTGLPSTTGGLNFPFSFPFAFDATSVSGDVTLTTDHGGWWFFVIAGPVVNPRIIVLQPDGTTTTLAWSMTVLADETLVVDPQAHTAMLQGTASRPPTIRQWPALTPGQTTVQFRADSGTGQLAVYYVPAK